MIAYHATTIPQPGSSFRDLVGNCFPTMARPAPAKRYQRVSSQRSSDVVRKRAHEFRDPVHTFICVDDRDRKVIDSAPVQRLRNIHQLAMSFLVYPDATHQRFEHSLGVMQLAEQVFDVVTDPNNLTDSLKDALPEFNDPD